MAERIFEGLRRQGGVAEPMGIVVDEGYTMWLLPNGVAEGSFTFLEACGLHVTIFPRSKAHSSLYAGMGVPRCVRTIYWSRFRLWDQERFVYLLERHSALIRAMENMDKLFPIPRRKGHLDNDVTPYPEDFGFVAEREANSICIEALEQWLRDA